MPVIKRIVAAAVYVIVAAAVFELKLAALFNVRQLLLFAVGTLLLCLPSVDFAKKLPPPPAVIGDSALYAGVIQTFLQLFIALSSLTAVAAFSRTVALNSLPAFYGLLLRAILADMHEKPRSDSENAASKPVSVTVESVGERFVALGLTRRESEVATLACKGLSNCEIAGQLTITEATVKKHLSNIFDKLEITRREQLRALVLASEHID